MKLVLMMLISASALAAPDASHATWDKILKAHVTVNGVASTADYRAIKAKPDALNAYTKSLSDTTQEELDRFNEKEKLAFLINAYNAFTVKLIVDNYPVKSIKDLGGFLSTPWKREFFKLLGKDAHLDHIEHDLIRAKFDEPRIHFAIVCASKGCPALRNEAFTATKLEAQLESNARNFLKDTTRNRFEAKENKLYLSKIFDWFAKDFEKADGVRKFVASRMAADKVEETKMLGAGVSFTDYDWTLNESPSEVARKR